MQENHPTYDAAALKSRYIAQHGTDLGTLVFDSETNRRRLQDERHTELTIEMALVHTQISDLSSAAGRRQRKMQARLEATYVVYLAECAEAATADSLVQAEIAHLHARSLEIQRQMLTIAEPRSTEEEVRNVAAYNSMNSGLLRSVDKTLPPLAPLPLSDLAKINLGVGLQTPCR
jgi:hypothetical protein